MLIPPLELTGLTKVFPTPSGPYVAVKDVNVQVQPGEFVCILGHSGCGKSTVLSIVAGLDEATYGGVVIDGTEVRGPGTDRAVVFQSPCLLPWLTARENVELARRATARRRHAACRPTTTWSSSASPTPATNCPRPFRWARSSACRWRARCRSSRKFLLLDEPFAQLDSLTRFELQDVLLGVWDDPRRIVVMVTHDVDEALYLADRLILMTDGPEATVGDVLRVPFPRPAIAKSRARAPGVRACYRHVIDFLEHHVQQLRPSPLDDILHSSGPERPARVRSNARTFERSPANDRSGLAPGTRHPARSYTMSLRIGALMSRKSFAPGCGAGCGRVRDHRPPSGSTRRGRPRSRSRRRRPRRASGGPTAPTSPTRATPRSIRSTPRTSASSRSPGASRPTPSDRARSSTCRRRR